MMRKLLVALAVLVLPLSALPARAGTGVALDHGKVVICAATTNPNAPYKFAELWPGTVFQGKFPHGVVYHKGVKKWGDIIPPFFARGRGRYDGYNWTTPYPRYGAPTWDNNCREPGPNGYVSIPPGETVRVIQP